MRSLVFSMTAAGALAVAIPRSAEAVPCDQIPGLANPVYLQVGDTQTALMKRLGARAARQRAAADLDGLHDGRLVHEHPRDLRPHRDRGGHERPVRRRRSPRTRPGTRRRSPTLTCQVPAGGEVPDIANSALFNSACTTEHAARDGRSYTQGPVQAYVMAVPEASTQTAITFEEAYFVFGFGMAGMVVAVDRRRRSCSSARSPRARCSRGRRTSRCPPTSGRACGATARRWWSPTLADSARRPEKAIGILGAEVYDSRRDTLNVARVPREGPVRGVLPGLDADARSTRRTCATATTRCGRRRSGWTPTAGGAPVEPERALRHRPDRRQDGDARAGFDMIAVDRRGRAGPRLRDGRARAASRAGSSRMYEPARELHVQVRESLVDARRAARRAPTHVRDRRLPQRLLRGAVMMTRAFRSRFRWCSPRRAATMARDAAEGRRRIDADRDPGRVVLRRTRTTHDEIINACTTAQKIYKDPNLPLLNPDGTLPPLPP